ncbi:semaphorin-4E [Entelurus aequoreus]|uniref:semaphorin-4E n=1 Tax=Entelurus aequoreus TaxID=161455 RepID=UPI002B1DAD53|nr:semaphorin-4E [Entelurus aequoreus]
MHPLVCISSFCLLPLALMLDQDSTLDCVPRRSVPYHSESALLFLEEGVSNYTTMLLREDLGLLLLGAREAVYALDLFDISKKQASVKWEVTKQQKADCQGKGKEPETECKNYIRILHKMADDRMYVCGTNAFNPECGYMTYAGGKLTLEPGEDGKGKCPFDPFQRYASIMVDDDLYSATSMNFLGSEPVLMRSSSSPIRTELRNSWLNEPTFVSMAHMPESDQSAEGDDDKVYLFFSETAVECDCYNKLVVSRVARVCKGDLGGERTLQKKWTSFLKARLECPVLDSQVPHVIRDTYRWCDPRQPWKECLFFAVFTPQFDTSHLSAVCAYRVADITKVFAEGKFKTPVAVETFIKWVMYSGDVPVPRPGACIDHEARQAGITQSLDLPDRTLQFIQDRPLMDQAIKPVGAKPLLVRRGSAFTCIVVQQVQAADGQKYHVMFIGTEDGMLLKAVNYDGEMFIIEQVQIFPAAHSVKILRFSDMTDHLYAGSDYAAVQVPVVTCGRSSSCLDCVLARDPHCGWDDVTGSCITISSTQRGLIQSAKEGDASLCPKAAPVPVVNRSISPSENVKLLCASPSDLATSSWEQDGRHLTSSRHLQLLPDGLLILNATESDAGLYRCVWAERSKGGEYAVAVVEYQLSVKADSGPAPEPRRAGASMAGWQTAVGVLLLLLLALLAWNFYSGHLPLPRACGRTRGREDGSRDHASADPDALRSGRGEDKMLVPGSHNFRSNNNHTDGNGGEEDDATRVTLSSLQFINDESEI